MLKISSSGSSNAGKKNINEDNFYMNGIYIADNSDTASGRIYSDSDPRDIYFYAVFDGIGEDIKSVVNPNMDFYEGQTASFAAADMLSRLQRHLKTKTEYNIHSYINSFVKKTNKNICDYMRQRNLRTGVSFALLCFHGNYAYAYNIGNSKIFLLRDYRVTQISKNDTQAESLVLAKQINADIVRHTPENKILTQYLGIFDNEKPLNLHSSRISVKAGDKFLICTDGLCDITEDRIFQIMSRDMSEQEIVTDLMNEALRNGGGENITAIVVGANYQDNISGKADLLKPSSADAVTNIGPIIFRNKFEFKPKHIKYILYAAGALVLFIITIYMLITSFFPGDRNGNDGGNNNGDGQNQVAPGNNDRGTGNEVFTEDRPTREIHTLDPNYIPTDDDTEEPTDDSTDGDTTTEGNTAPPPPTNPPAQQPTNPPATNPPPTNPPAQQPTNPPATNPPPTNPPAQQPTDPPGETPTDAPTEETPTETEPESEPETDAPPTDPAPEPEPEPPATDPPPTEPTPEPEPEPPAEPAAD